MESSTANWSKVEEKGVSQENLQMSYYQESVFVHLFSSDVGQDKIFGGTLSIEEVGSSWHLKWSPTKELEEERFPTDVEFVQPNSNSVIGKCSTANSIKVDLETSSSCLKQQTQEKDWMMVAEKKSTDANHNKDDLSSTDAKSQDNDVFEFSFNVPINNIRYLKKSNRDFGWRYIILELRDGASLPVLHFHAGGYKELMKTLRFHVTKIPCRDRPRWYDVTSINPGALTKSFDELNIFDSSDSKKHKAGLLEDPIATAYSGLSKVSSFLQGMINPAQKKNMKRPRSECANLDFLRDDFDVGNDYDPGRFQIAKDVEEAANGFEVITCTQLQPRICVNRMSPMTKAEWNGYKDSQGRIRNVEVVKQRIFKGCVQAEMRSEVWKYLLGFFEWSNSAEENETLRKEKENDYYRMKKQWKSMNADQMSRFAEFGNRRHAIEKDVMRTDRTRSFYAEDDGWGLLRLDDILTTYCMYNFDLGYVQGMTDLLSPILEIMKDESDAFWCFVQYMNITQDNFGYNLKGLRMQLRDLRILLEFFDPQLWDQLHLKESTDMFFCFRWLLVLFKRELNFEGVQRLWEVFWTKVPCDNFQLIFCLALLDNEKKTLMDEDCGFSEILKHINQLEDRIDLEETLKKAEGIFVQLLTCEDLTANVKLILGLQ